MMTNQPFSAGKVIYGIQPSTVKLLIREPVSALTHFAALICLLTGGGPLLMKASEYGSRLTVAGMWVFLTGCCMLYAASAAYHTVVLDQKLTRIFKKADHMMISIMIAGTYTPICLTVLRGKTGFLLLTAVWILAAGGILMKALWVTCPRWVSSILYLCMGWLCLFAFVPLFTLLPRAAFLWLLAGGLFYSVGAVIYALKLSAFNQRNRYFGSHELFHLFIMAGTACHYIVMYGYISRIP